ncbi:MAG: hypothetical protein PHQ98_01055 [Candidatus ainarchaeum sp.]|nr:hypothetical protein [Candidatus ainarchaeum sp.]
MAKKINKKIKKSNKNSKKSNKQSIKVENKKSNKESKKESKPKSLIDKIKSFLMISLILLSITLLLPSAFAVSINGNSTLAMCQCETVRETYQVCSGSNSGTYSLSLSDNGAKWASIAPQVLTLNSNECKDVYFFVTPECYANSGTYYADLKVTGPASTSKLITLNVDECHNFEFNITPKNNISGPCEENYYQISVKNTGEFVSEYLLVLEGLPSSWVNYPKTSFVLNPNEDITSMLVVKSECNTSKGYYPFTLQAKNTKKNDSQTIDLNQQIIDYKPFVTTVQNSIKSCVEKNEEFSFSLENVSTKTDEFNISILGPEFITVDKTQFTLTPNAKENLILKLTNPLPHASSISLAITSKNYAKTYYIPINLTIEDCTNFSLSKETTQTEYCFGKIEQKFKLKNTGTQLSSINLSIEGIDSTSTSIVLNPNEESIETLYFDSNTIGTKNIKVLATSANEVKTLEYTLDVQNCYDSDLVITDINACPSTTVTKQILLKNSGSKSQQFELSSTSNFITFKETNVLVDAYSSKTVDFIVNVPTYFTSAYQIKATSDETVIERTANLTQLTNDVCYDYSLNYSNETMDANCCAGHLLTVYVRNDSQFDQTYTIQKLAPPWTTTNVDSIKVNANDYGTVYVYFAPPAGSSGLTPAKIQFTNESGIVKYVDLNVNVFGEGCGADLAVSLNVDNNVSSEKEYRRIEYVVDFKVTNDSNIGFNVFDMNLNKINADINIIDGYIIGLADQNIDVNVFYKLFKVNFDFEKGIYLSPNQNFIARMTISVPENTVSKLDDVNIIVNILTSAGTITKNQSVKLSNTKSNLIDDSSMVGLFGGFAAPLIGVLFLILVLVGIIFFVTKNKQSGDDDSKPKRLKKK